MINTIKTLLIKLRIIKRKYINFNEYQLRINDINHILFINDTAVKSYKNLMNKERIINNLMN